MSFSLLSSLEFKYTPIGVYLNSKEDKSENDILLPGKQVPKDAKIGDEVEV
ncbi:RNA-binding protein, partial [Clostridium sporogenes]|uniref:S1-like domain-containing RNA-binding protein n=1 Tax=Clostridium sporogenes TaxID=1509 RepID=UPI0013FC6AE8|nr:RNA-binding protein [Clostridium sporogenes]